VSEENEAENEQIEEAPETEVENEAEGQESPDAETDDGEEGLLVTFGDEDSPPQEDEPAPEWVRELRKTNREQKRRIKELEDSTKDKASAAKSAELGPKPTLASNDYDEDKFSDQMAAWHDRKREIAQQEQIKAAADKKTAEAWDAKQARYNDGKTSLGVKDYDEAEEAVKDLLSGTQQGIIVHSMDDPARFVYALGRNPQKAKELAQISDPVLFAVAAAKLETTMKSGTRTQKPNPERTIKGAGPSSGGADSTLQKLRDDAAKSGDFTKVNAYKKQKRAQS